MGTSLGFTFNGEFRNLDYRRYACNSREDLLYKIFTESGVLVALEGHTSENLDMLTEEQSPLEYVEGPQGIDNYYELRFKTRMFRGLKPHMFMGVEFESPRVNYVDLRFDGQEEGGLSLGSIREPLFAMSRYVEGALLKMKPDSFMFFHGLEYSPDFANLSYHLSEHGKAHYIFSEFRGNRNLILGNNPREDITISNGRLIQ